MSEDVRAPNHELAFEDYQKGLKYKEIAEKYGVSVSAVKSWASRYWKKQEGCNHQKLQPKKVATKGGQPGNKNAVGNSGGAAPKQNKNAEKYGFFSKYLPEETREIFNAIEQADPLDLLWHQIQIAYTAIIRAQRIAYVKDQQDKTIEKVEEKKGKIIGERWEVQQAWDKQNEFLKA